jgi:hypothetical protein
MTHGAGGDQTVDPGANGEARPASSSIEVDGLLENLLTEGRFDNWEREHGVTGDPKRRLITKTLEHLLDDRQTRDYLFDVRYRIEGQPARSAKHLDPDGRINENHESGGPRFETDRPASRPSSPPTGQIRLAQGFDSRARDARIR